jgi:hypothetical protein
MMDIRTFYTAVMIDKKRIVDILAKVYCSRFARRMYIDEYL